MIQVSFDNIIKNHGNSNNFDRVDGSEVLRAYGWCLRFFLGRIWWFLKKLMIKVMHAGWCWFKNSYSYHGWRSDLFSNWLSWHLIFHRCENGLTEDLLDCWPILRQLAQTSSDQVLQILADVAFEGRSLGLHLLQQLLLIRAFPRRFSMQHLIQHNPKRKDIRSEAVLTVF